MFPLEVNPTFETFVFQPAPEEEGGCNNLRVWDCAVLKVAVNPACSFRVDNGWTQTINSEIMASGGCRTFLSLSFSPSLFLSFSLSPSLIILLLSRALQCILCASAPPLYSFDYLFWNIVIIHCLFFFHLRFWRSAHVCRKGERQRERKREREKERVYKACPRPCKQRDTCHGGQMCPE